MGEDQRRMVEAKVRLGLVVQLYHDQLPRGGHFLHEHPATAESWEDEAMADFLADPQGLHGGRAHVPPGDVPPGRRWRCPAGAQAYSMGQLG